MHVEKWLREMSSIPETDVPIKQALAHGLLLHLKISTLFFLNRW